MLHILLVHGPISTLMLYTTIAHLLTGQAPLRARFITHCTERSTPYTLTDESKLLAQRLALLCRRNWEHIIKRDLFTRAHRPRRINGNFIGRILEGKGALCNGQTRRRPPLATDSPLLHTEQGCTVTLCPWLTTHERHVFVLLVQHPSKEKTQPTKRQQTRNEPKETFLTLVEHCAKAHNRYRE